MAPQGGMARAFVTADHSRLEAIGHGRGTHHDRGRVWQIELG
jgi:hypothetical protein